MSSSVGHRWGLGVAWLWLWCRQAATDLIRPLAWEPPYPTGAAVKRKEKKNIKLDLGTFLLNPPQCLLRAPQFTSEFLVTVPVASCLPLLLPPGPLHLLFSLSGTLSPLMSATSHNSGLGLSPPSRSPP